MATDKVLLTREEILERLSVMLFILRDHKPDDRSEDDRYFAITITEMEKVVAIFQTYLVRD